LFEGKMSRNRIGVGENVFDGVVSPWDRPTGESISNDVHVRSKFDLNDAFKLINNFFQNKNRRSQEL
jgi:hypothetical protein